MSDVEKLIEGLRSLVSQADDVVRANKSIELKMCLKIQNARDYLDRTLNQISRKAA